jgi:hypothetical protein
MNVEQCFFFRLVYDPNLGQDVILSDTPLSKVGRYYSFPQLLTLFASFLRVLTTS